MVAQSQTAGLKGALEVVGGNIKDLLVPVCTWDGFLTNSFLVPPSLLLQESESVGYCFKRRVHSSEAWLGDLGYSG